jgi:hypothetical protein
MLSLSGLYNIGDRVINEYGALGEMGIGKGNQSTERKPASVPFCPLQIPHDMTWDQTWAQQGKLVTNHLSYRMAILMSKQNYIRVM